MKISAPPIRARSWAARQFDRVEKIKSTSENGRAANRRAKRKARRQNIKKGRPG